MRYSTGIVLPVAALFAKLSTAGYVLQDDYGNSASFFDKFQFFTVSIL